MESGKPIEIRKKLLTVFEHTIVLIFILLSIASIHWVLTYTLGANPTIFGVIPIRYITDLADLIVFIWYLLNLIRSLRS